MDKKTCTKCKEEKELVEFLQHKSGRQKRHSWCRSCTTKAIMLWAARTGRNKHYGERNRQYVNKLKTVPCMDCGASYPPFVMDLDHREGELKTLHVSRMVSQHVGLAKLAAEIAKCDVVCANCHRIRTHNRQIALKEAV